MSKGHIEDIKNRLKISQVVSRKVSLKARNAMSFQGLCPFHDEKSPSFHVHDDKGFYHCFGCGAGGDIFDFVMRSEGLEFGEALKRLAQESGVELPKKRVGGAGAYDGRKVLYEIYEVTQKYYAAQLKAYGGVQALAYLLRRGIDMEVIEYFGLGYAPYDSQDLLQLLRERFNDEDLLKSGVIKKLHGGKLSSFFYNRVIFPIYDMRSRVIAFGGRALGDDGPKYLNSPESEIFIKSEHLYNLNKAARAYKVRGRHPVTVVEGYMDVIALHQAGVVTAVAPMGTAFKPEQLKIVWGVCKEPLMLFDNDLAGYNALHKVVYGALEQIGQHQMLQIGSLKRAKDPDDMLRQFGIPALLSVVEAPSAVSEYILDYELQLKPYKTPEQKFDLEKRLALVASAIKDRDLQRQYQIFFKDSLWQLNRRTKKGHVAESSRDVTNEYISGVMHQPDPLIHKLSKVMMLYPQLLLDNQLFEGYIDLNFTSGDLEAFRIELLKSFDIISSDGGEKDKMARDFMMLSDAMMKKFPKIASIPTEVVDYDEAFSYAIRLIKLISLGRLSAEIEMISRKMSQVADDVDFQKFKHLLEIQETLKLELGVI